MTEVPAAERPPWRLLFCGGAVMTVVVIVLFVSTGALRGHFMADDFSYVNFGRAMSPVPFFDSLRLYWFPMPAEVGLQYYRPTIGLSYAWDWAWTGRDAFGYRVTNLCLHIGSAWLLLAITWRLTRSGLAAVAACWLFALSPAHPETLLWISARVNLLATFFVLLALLAHLLRRAGGSFVWLLVAIVATAIALTSKETGIIIPPLLLVQVWFDAPAGVKGWKSRALAAFRCTAYAWLLVVPYLMLRWHVLGTLGGGYLNEGERDYLSLAYVMNRFDLLHMLFSPVALTQWSSLAKFGLLILHVCMAAVGFVAIRRNMLRPQFAFAAAWLALALLPIYKAPFTESTLQDSRLLYEPTIAVVLLIVTSLTALDRTTLSKYTRALGVIAMIVYPTLLIGNMVPWLRMGSVSLSLDTWARDSASANFTDRWVVDLPVVVDGAYLFLGESAPIPLMMLDPELTSRLHGLRTKHSDDLLREGNRRCVAGTLGDWDLWRMSSIDGQVERETIDSAFPVSIGGLEVRWARSSKHHLRAGEMVAGQLIVQNATGEPVTLTVSLELWPDSRRYVFQTSKHSIDGQTQIVVTGSLPLPIEVEGTLHLHLKFTVGTETTEVSLGQIRVDPPR